MSAAPPARVTVVGQTGRRSTARMLDAVAAAEPGISWKETVVLLSRGDSLPAAGEPPRSWSEVLSGIGDDAIVVVSAAEPRLRDAAALSGARVVTFGLDARADVRGAALHAGSRGTTYVVSAAGESHEVRMQLLGEHLAENSLAALAAAVANGAALSGAVAALESLESAGTGVMEPHHASGDALVIDDSAGMAPPSMTAALKALAMFGVEGRRTVAVLGPLDLPRTADATVAQTAERHREAHDHIGRLVVRLNISQLIVVGDDARHIHNAAGLEGSWNGESVLVDELSEAYDRVREDLGRDDVVLVKHREAAGTLGVLTASTPGGVGR